MRRAPSTTWSSARCTPSAIVLPIIVAASSVSRSKRALALLAARDRDERQRERARCEREQVEVALLERPAVVRGSRRARRAGSIRSRRGGGDARRARRPARTPRGSGAPGSNARGAVEQDTRQQRVGRDEALGRALLTAGDRERANRVRIVLVAQPGDVSVGRDQPRERRQHEARKHPVAVITGCGGLEGGQGSDLLARKGHTLISARRRRYR